MENLQPMAFIDEFKIGCNNKTGFFYSIEVLRDHCISCKDWYHRMVLNYLIEMYEIQPKKCAEYIPPRPKKMRKKKMKRN